LRSRERLPVSLPEKPVPAKDDPAVFFRPGELAGTFQAVVFFGSEAVLGGGELAGAEARKTGHHATAGHRFEDRERNRLETTRREVDGVAITASMPA